MAEAPGNAPVSPERGARRRMKLPRWATTLDVVAVVMALVAASVAIGGGFRIWIFDSRLSVTSWWRPALVSVLAIAIRHALLREQPLPRRVMQAVVESLAAPSSPGGWRGLPFACREAGAGNRDLIVNAGLRELTRPGVTGCSSISSGS